MSKSPTVIPAADQDVGEWNRPQGEVRRSLQNPEGNRKAQYVGTPKLTEQELTDREIIRQNREVLYRAEPLIREVTDLLRTSVGRVEYVKAIEEAIAKVKASRA